MECIRAEAIELLTAMHLLTPMVLRFQNGWLRVTSLWERRQSRTEAPGLRLALPSPQLLWAGVLLIVRFESDEQRTAAAHAYQAQ